jgi:molybdopterin/thiamine biosynthesis adenylyltransferase
MAHVIVVGCGNIGSQLIPHLGRLTAVDRVTLVDDQAYEPGNIRSQAIDAADVGKPKSRVQSARLRRIRPDMSVEAVVSPVECLPRGSLRCDLILSGLDSRLARMRLGQSLWRLGDVPWIDAGVDPENLLARVSAYFPGEGRPCYECAWSDRDYQALEAAYPCDPGAESPRSTNAPSGLGSLAASLQVIAAQKLLEGRPDLVPMGHELVIDARHHKQYLTILRRNPRCRFDHQVWTIEEFEDDACSLGRALTLHGGRLQGGESSLRVEGKLFVKRLVCANCGHARHLVRLRESLGRREKTCPLCGRPLLAGGWDLAEKLTDRLPRGLLSRSLASLGLREGEIFSVSDGESERHFEITVTGHDRSRPANRQTPGGQGLGRGAGCEPGAGGGAL